VSERPAPPADLMVLPSPDGRFALFRRDDLFVSAGPVSSVRDVVPEMARVLGQLTWHSEADARSELARLGLGESDIDERIAGARRKLAVMSSAPTIMERLTEIGYRNPDGQQVIGAIDRWRSANAGIPTDRIPPEADLQVSQRVFRMRCTVCGAEYGAYGCDIDIRRCPACQDGPPGVWT
jgi:hypothetical protein